MTDRSVIPYKELEKIANQSGIFEQSEVSCPVFSLCLNQNILEQMDFGLFKFNERTLTKSHQV